MRTFLAVFLLSASLWAQTETSLTVTSTRSISVQPDQTVLLVTVTTPLSTGMDDVLAVVSGVGITASELSGVYSTSFTDSAGRVSVTTTVLQSTFSLPVPLVTIKASLNSLTALQEGIAKNNPGWTLDYNSNGQLQASAAAQAAQPCPLADLLADAQAQAQKLVAASPAFSVGPILALSDGSGSAQAAGAAYYFIASTVSLSLVRLGYFTATPTPTCTLVVKFALQRYQ